VQWKYPRKTRNCYILSSLGRSLSSTESHVRIHGFLFVRRWSESKLACGHAQKKSAVQITPLMNEEITFNKKSLNLFFKTKPYYIFSCLPSIKKHVYLCASARKAKAWTKTDAQGGRVTGKQNISGLGKSVASKKSRKASFRNAFNTLFYVQEFNTQSFWLRSQGHQLPVFLR